MSTHLSNQVSPSVVRIEHLRRRGLELEAELRAVEAAIEREMVAVQVPVVQTPQQPAVLR